MSLQPDTTILNNKYHIVRLIGVGGMARVWLAEELTFGGRPVALKEPRQDLTPDVLDEVAQRYRREVAVCAALEQASVAHVVRALTAEPVGDGVLLVMTYLPGGDLAALLQKNPAGLPIPQAVTIVQRLLVALHGAHEHPLEIVHRDIKPSNILFDAQGQAYLGDFGLAQVANASGNLTKLRGGGSVGTPLYAAPEQMMGTGYLTPAVDLYALGCVAFEMLTGKRYKRFKPGTLASSLRPEIPRWLDEALGKALEDDPWQRWESAVAMAEALQTGAAAAQRQAAAAALDKQRQTEAAEQRHKAAASAELEKKQQTEEAERQRKAAEAAAWEQKRKDAGERQTEAEKVKSARREAELAQKEAEAARRARQEQDQARRATAEQARREAEARWRLLPWAVGAATILALMLAVWHPWTGGGASTPAPTPAPTAAPTAVPAATKAPEATKAPVATGPKGELTLWHAYGTGSAEEKALTQALAAMKAEMPDVKVNVLQIPFDQVFNKWETEVAAGGGPDMFTAPNDNTGNEVRAGLLAPLDDLLKGKTDAFPPASFEGAKVDGKVYGVPGIIKAVALYYNKSTIPTPPNTTDELMALVKAGKKIEINQNNYHNFGWLTGAFGGKLMDDTGKCTANQGGLADALQFMADLKAAGADFQTDGGKADILFRQGQADMIINGPWVLGDYKKDLGDKLGVAPMPAGPKGPATPLAGVDYWHVNPNVSADQQKLAVGVALYIFGPKGAQIYADVAGSPMVAKGVTAADPLVKAFADAAAAGAPRPQNEEFGNWWGPFGDAVTKVMEGQLKPVDAVAEACATMNKANGKEAGAASVGKLAGEVTMWHTYGAGSAEEKALTQVLDAMKKDMPDLKVNVRQIPFDYVFNKWETEVAAGGGPDMFTVPNDNTGNEARAGLLAPLDDLLKGKTDAFPPASFEGAVVDGKVYGVPGIIKAVALYYNKSTVPTPPKTTDELMALVKAGKKIEINQNAYHNFGWLTGAFGGKLMDDTGKCTANQGGFADALQFMVDLKAAGADFQTDGGKANTLFRQGQADMIINGPWVLGDYKKDLGDKLGVAPMPGGPGGPATPLAVVDYWHVNPNIKPEQQKLAVGVALYIFGPKGAQIYADVAGSPMVAKGVTAADPLVKAFAEAAAAGFSRPQSKEFGNWWNPFFDAFTKVMEGQLKPVDAVAEACATMNKANGK